MSELKMVAELTGRWNDDGASRGPAHIELRDLAKQLESELSASQAREAALREKLAAYTLTPENYEWTIQQLSARAEAAEARNAELTNKLESGWVKVCDSGLAMAHEEIAELRKLLESKVQEGWQLVPKEGKE